MSYAQSETFFETLPEFLAWEERQEERYEFIGGKIFAMVGASLAHNRIIRNLSYALQPVHRKPPCQVFAEGVKLTIGNDSFYPDVLVNCSSLSMQAKWVTDAVLLAEVLSPSTEHQDRGSKLHRYTTLPGVRHYLIVSQEQQIIEHYSRSQDRSWQFGLLGPPESVHLAAFDIDVPIAAIYEGSEVPA